MFLFLLGKGIGRELGSEGGCDIKGGKAVFCLGVCSWPAHSLLLYFRMAMIKMKLHI